MDQKTDLVYADGVLSENSRRDECETRGTQRKIVLWLMKGGLAREERESDRDGEDGVIQRDDSG